MYMFHSLVESIAYISLNKIYFHYFSYICFSSDSIFLFNFILFLYFSLLKFLKASIYFQRMSCACVCGENYTLFKLTLA